MIKPKLKPKYIFTPTSDMSMKQLNQHGSLVLSCLKENLLVLEVGVAALLLTAWLAEVLWLRVFLLTRTFFSVAGLILDSGPSGSF